MEMVRQEKEEKMLSIARNLAETNKEDMIKLEQQGASKEQISQYIERKNFHLINMLNLMKEGISWMSYPNVYSKARNKAMAETKLKKEDIRQHFFDDIK